MEFADFMKINYPKITKGSGWEYHMAKKIWAAAYAEGMRIERTRSIGL